MPWVIARCRCCSCSRASGDDPRGEDTEEVTLQEEEEQDGVPEEALDDVDEHDEM